MDNIYVIFSITRVLENNHMLRIWFIQALCYVTLSFFVISTIVVKWDQSLPDLMEGCKTLIETGRCDDYTSKVKSEERPEDTAE